MVLQEGYHLFPDFAILVHPAAQVAAGFASPHHPPPRHLINPLPINPPLPRLLVIQTLVLPPSPLLKGLLFLLAQTKRLLQPAKRAPLLLHLHAILRHRRHVAHDAHAHRARGIPSLAHRRVHRGGVWEARRGAVGEFREVREVGGFVHVVGGWGRGPWALEGRVGGGVHGAEVLLLFAAGGGDEVSS